MKSNLKIERRTLRCLTSNRCSSLSVVLLFTMGLLHGCATNMQSTPPAAAVRGPALTVIQPPEPFKLSMMTIGDPAAASNSLESALIFGGKMSGFAQLLMKATASLDFHAGRVLNDALAADLSRSGRATTRLPSTQTDRREFLDNYQALGVTSGVIVDVIPVAVGYWNTYPDGPLRPWVVLTYREYDVTQRMVVATGQIGTGPSPDGNPITPVAADDRFAFASFDALTANPQRAVAGMKSAIEKVAQALAQKL
jgi:hypothetical protein